ATRSAPGRRCSSPPHLPLATKTSATRRPQSGIDRSRFSREHRRALLSSPRISFRRSGGKRAGPVSSWKRGRKRSDGPRTASAGPCLATPRTAASSHQLRQGTRKCKIPRLLWADAGKSLPLASGRRSGGNLFLRRKVGAAFRAGKHLVRIAPVLRIEHP